MSTSYQVKAVRDRSIDLGFVHLPIAEDALNLLTIARQEDCQTCFMCEAYCPADALYVAPESHTKVEVDEDDLIDRDIVGEYRRTLGWGYGRKNNSELDTAHKLRQLPRPYES